MGVLDMVAHSKIINQCKNDKNGPLKNNAVLVLMFLVLQAAWITPVLAVPGDITGEGFVDLEDLDVMMYWWMITPCEIFKNCEGADMTGPNNEPDGVVDLHDFVLLAAHWLETNNV